MEDQKVYRPKLFWQQGPRQSTHCDDTVVACVGIGKDSYLDVYALKDEIQQAEEELLKALSDKSEAVRSEVLSFSEALSAAKNGAKISRKGWNHQGTWIKLQRSDDYNRNPLPYLYLNFPEDFGDAPAARVPWLVSQTDLLATDWFLVE